MLAELENYDHPPELSFPAGIVGGEVILLPSSIQIGTLGQEVGTANHPALATFAGLGQVVQVLGLPTISGVAAPDNSALTQSLSPSSLGRLEFLGIQKIRRIASQALYGQVDEGTHARRL